MLVASWGIWVITTDRPKETLDLALELCRDSYKSIVGVIDGAITDALVCNGKSFQAYDRMYNRAIVAIIVGVIVSLLARPPFEELANK